MCPKLVAVTVNYACADAILEGMAETVAQLEDIGDAQYWIVDNASPDNSLQMLSDAIGQRGWDHIVHVIPSDQNGGFGAGNNVAICRGLAQSAKPDYFYFLNPDAIPQANAIGNFIAFMEATPNAGIAGGRLCDEDGTIQTSAFRFPSFWSEIEDAVSLGIVSRLLRRHIPSLPEPATPQRVDWVAGTSFIMRRKALEAAGAFDESFFLYWEEIELCHRVDAAGFGIWAIPEAVVMHTGGVSTGMHKPEKRMPDYWFASRRYFFQATGRGGNQTGLNVAVAFGLILRRAHQLLRGRTLNPPHYLLDFLKYNFLQQNVTQTALAKKTRTET